MFEIHANSINHKRNINPAGFDAALEVEFSFISKSLECSDKMFCKICKMEVLPDPLRIKAHEKSKIHYQNVIFSEFPFVSRSKKETALCTICNSEFTMFSLKSGRKNSIHKNTLVMSSKHVRDHDNSKEHQTNLSMVDNRAPEAEFPSVSKSSTDPKKVLRRVATKMIPITASKIPRREEFTSGELYAKTLASNNPIEDNHAEAVLNFPTNTKQNILNGKIRVMAGVSRNKIPILRLKRVKIPEEV